MSGVSSRNGNYNQVIMTQQIVQASIAQFNALIRSPKAWQVLGLISWGLVRGDEIKYVEVDSEDVPTGRERIGVVFYVTVGDLLINSGTTTFYYCQDIQIGLDEAILGRSLIVG